jgi:hypothetical protein
MAKKLLFQKSDKAAPSSGGGPAVKTPPEGSDIMAILRSRRDRAIARRINTQNSIAKAELVSKEIVKLQFGKLFAIYRSVVLKNSFVSAPSILAILQIHNPGADARLSELIDDEAYLSFDKIIKAMKKYLQSRRTNDAE